ncbi:efflux RND transporter permease subunit [Planctomycetota bacterium]
MIENIIKFALKYKLMVVLLFAAVCMVGVYSLLELPIDAFPDVSPNLVQVFAEVEGTAAEEIEQLVSRPIEVAMMGLPKVKTIRSRSAFGLSTVDIIFEDGMDIYRAHELVNQRLAAAEEGIPESLDLHHGLKKGPIASGMGKILAYYVYGEGYSLDELRTLQDWVIERNIQTVPGVADVISQGGHIRQYKIVVIPQRLLEYDLTFEDLIEAVGKNNLNLGAGVIERGAEELMVRCLGLINNIPDIENIAVSTHNGHPIYIKDIARVEFGNAFRRGVASLNGESEVVVGGVYKLYGANSFEVIERLKKRIDEINATLPEGVSVTIFYDQSELVKSTINTVWKALGLGLVLVILVAFIFLGNARNALIMVLSLPFSILLTFIVMKRCGMSGDLISFGGVAIALGMIIDATIIMVEKIQTALKKDTGDSSIAEVILATGKEIGPPIFFAISIIIIVFIPILTLREVEGKMFRPLGFTVMVTMMGSLIYALLVAPVLYSVLHRHKSPKKQKKDYLAIFHGAYRVVLSFFLKQRVLVAVLMIVLLGAGGWFFTRLGQEFLPTLQEGDIQVSATLNPNVSLKEISRVALDLEKEIIKLPEVSYALSDIGYGEVSPHVHHTNYACITVSLLPRDQWPTKKSYEQLSSEIRECVDGYPGVNIGISQPIKHELDHMITGATLQVAAKLFGPNLEVLKAKAAEIEAAITGIEGAVDVMASQFAGQTQIQVALDGAKLSRHGLDKLEVLHIIHDGVGGEDVGNVFEEDKTFTINLRFDEQYRNDIEAIKNILVRTPAGYTVPIEELLEENEIKEVTGIREITREDTHRYVTIQCNVEGRDVGGFVEEARQAVAQKVDLPPEYRLDWGGQFELQQAANRRLAIIIPITLFLVLIMLYSLFNSLKNVLLVMLNIPLALVGGVLALYFFGGNLSIPSSIGFIALFGIALTDGLVLISRFEFLRGKGLALKEAVTEGSLSKLRPVLMTTITTAFGLLPLIISSGIGSEIQKPLAIVVVGGLVSSTILTLIVLPTLYLSFSRDNKI